MQIHAGLEDIAEGVVLSFTTPRVDDEPFSTELHRNIGRLFLLERSQDVPKAGPLLSSVFFGSKFLTIGSQHPKLIAKRVHLIELEVIVAFARNLVQYSNAFTRGYPQVNIG